MTDDEILRGTLELRLYRSRDGKRHRREILYEVSDSKLTESSLRQVAWHELARHIGAGFGPSGGAYHPATFDWRTVFKAGDVVRCRIDGRIGVVIDVINSSADVPMYELLVDTAKDGLPEGIGCWDPWIMETVNDPAIVAEVRRLELRGLEGGP